LSSGEVSGKKKTGRKKEKRKEGCNAAFAFRSKIIRVAARAAREPYATR